MDFSTKDITIIALTVALIVVCGWVIYLISNLIPVPGFKFIGVTVFSSFMIYFPVYKVKHAGVYLGTTAIFAGIMSFISLLMGLAIILTGIMTELLAWLFMKNYNSWRTILITGCFSFLGTLNSLIITYYLTEVPILNLQEMLIPALLFVISSLLGGCLGAYLAHYIIEKHLEHLFN